MKCYYSPNAAMRYFSPAFRLGYVTGLRGIPHDPVCPYRTADNQLSWLAGFRSGRSAVRAHIMYQGGTYTG